MERTLGVRFKGIDSRRRRGCAGDLGCLGGAEPIVDRVGH